MQSWLVPNPPRLNGSPARGPVRVYDTSAGRVVATNPGRAARLYVCGITPYDATHIGHAATYIAFDLLNRAWRDAGQDVHFVQNVTDVDDPLLERAVATGQDWAALARAETEVFRADMTALNVLAPQDYIGAVESIPAVVEWVERLRAVGAAYQVDQDLYFDISTAGSLGAVAGLQEPEMLELFAQRGGDPDRPGKRHRLDPLLWLAARPDEPAWDTPLGHGRPGWHIECTAIAVDHLGVGFDVQGGGSDLAFPHHEMCAAQASAAAGEFARHYVHAGMVSYQGEKMSKSRGNLVFVSALRRAGHDPMAIRLAVLGQHYRSDWEWTAELLRAAEERLARWRAASLLDDGSTGRQLAGRVRAHLAADLNAPACLTAVDDWAGAILAGSAPRSASDPVGLPGSQIMNSLLGVNL